MRVLEDARARGDVVGYRGYTMKIEDDAGEIHILLTQRKRPKEAGA